MQTNGSGGWTLAACGGGSSSGVSYPVESYGAVGDATGAAGVGTNNTTAIQNCINAIEALAIPQGQCVLSNKKYRITSALTINKSGVGISGVSYGANSIATSNQLIANAPISALVIDSATADAVDASGGSLGTPISFNKFNDFTIIRTVAASSSGSGCGSGIGPAGLSIQYAGGFTVDRVWSEDSACNFYFQNAGAYGTGYVQNSGSLWGANGFNPGISVYGFFLAGTNSAESFRLRDSFSQTLYPGYSGVQSVGFIATGPHINDIMISRFETAFQTFGEYFQYTGGGGSVDSSDIHLLECINDSFFQDGIVVNGLVAANGGQVEINGGWDSTSQAGSASNSAGISVISSSGVTISNVGFGQIGSQKYGVLATSSSRLSVNGNTFLNMGNASIALSTVADSTITGNLISGTSGNTQTGIQGTSLTRSIMTGNSLSGFMSFGVTLDSGSANNFYGGVAAIDPANITTPTSNSGTNNAFDPASIASGNCTSPQFVQSITTGGVATCATPSGGGSGAMTLIQKQTLGSTVASVTFSSIPQTYTQLLLVGSFTAQTTNDNIVLQFNGDTTSTHYAWGLSFQNAGAASGARSVSSPSCFVGGGIGALSLTIPSYTAASSSVQASGTFSELIVGSQSISGDAGCAWTGTDVTSITLSMQGGDDLVSGSTFSLYGIN